MPWWLLVIGLGPLVCVAVVALVMFVTRVHEVEPAPLESGEPRDAIRAAIDRRRGD